MEQVLDRIEKLNHLGWTDSEIAGKLGVTRGTISLWKSGKRNSRRVVMILSVLDGILAPALSPKRADKENKDDTATG